MEWRGKGKSGNFFRAPSFADPEKNLAASQIFTIVRALVLSSVFLQIVQIALASGITGRWLGVLLATVAVCLILLAMTRRGHVRLAAYLLVASLWLLIGIFSWTASGLGARAAWGYFIVVFIAGMLLGRWLGLVAVGICSISTLVIALMGPIVSSDPVRFWLINTIYLLIVLLLQNLAGSSIREALAKTGNELRERLLAQAALFESERKHREMVNSLPFCVFEADLQGRFTFVNQTALEWFGYSREEFIDGLSIDRVLAENEMPQARENLKLIASGKEVSIHEYQVRRKDGSPFTALIRTRPIFENGLPVGLQGSLIDISERKKAEEELQIKDRALASSFNAVAIADLNGKLTYVNNAFLRMWGYDAEGAQHLTVADLDSDKNEIQRILGDIKRKGFSLGESLAIRKDGSHFNIQFSASLISNLAGEPIALLSTFIDITERMQAQDVLQARENMLSSILRAAPTGIGVVCNRVITLVNSRICEMTGWTQEELIGKSSRRLYPSDADFDYVGKEKYRQIAERGTGTVETRWQCKDGRIIDVLLSSTPIDPSDLSAGVTFTALDITESKRAEKALRMGNQFISSLLRAIPVAVFFKDKEGKYTGCNDAFTEILGVTSDEIKGKTVHEIWPSELAETYHRKDLELMKEKKHQVYEFQVKDKNGELRPVIYAKDVFIDANGEVGGLVGAFLDISDRKLAEEKLLESERRYRTLFDAAGDAIFVIKDNTFFDCNNKTLEMFGCRREEIIGTSPDQFSPPLQPDGRDSRKKALEKIRAAYGGSPQFFEWVHCKADGTPFIAEVSLSLIQLTGGAFLLAMVRDVSESKRLEEQLRQAQKMEAIGILAGGVAHDFNNILSTVVGYASLLKMKLTADDPLKEYIERILAATERAVNLTSSLLAFSRKQELELRPLDINDAIYGFHKILARLIGEDIDFHLQLASHSLPIDADVRQIEQVLMNLANNSRDAMPRGGKLTIRTEAVFLKKPNGEVPAGSYAVVTVADTGAGMDREVQAHIFEPFFTTKDVGKGTGLGLAIVYGIVKKHGGFIDVASMPGQGTAFSIYLPLKKLAMKKTTPRKQKPIPTGSETILLIEDDAAVRQVTRSMLEEFGYSVLEAAEGIAAQEVFRLNRERVQLILCDLIMPKMNGRETFAAIQKIKSDIKVIFMSGYTSDIIAGKGIADQGIHLLLKPLNPATLLTKVRNVLDK